jgi:hypothetical protein
MPLLGSRGGGSARGCGFAGLIAVEYDVDYLVIAGGGAGGLGNINGGGGAGGFRTSFPGGTQITLEGGDHPIVVGAGGTTVSATRGNQGGTSTFSTIDSAGGGGGGSGTGTSTGGAGGSGGGGCGGFNGPAAAGAGNTPPVSPSQGFPGSDGSTNVPTNFGAGAGGGASQAGQGSGQNAHPGGAGSSSSISGSSVTYAGGGGGGRYQAPVGNGGPGGGGAGGVAGTNGLGGGGGAGADGGSGRVIIRAPGDATLSVTPGTNQTSTAPGGEKIATFNVSGNLTVA